MPTVDDYVRFVSFIWFLHGLIAIVFLPFHQFLVLFPLEFYYLKSSMIIDILLLFLGFLANTNHPVST